MRSWGSLWLALVAACSSPNKASPDAVVSGDGTTPGDAAPFQAGNPDGSCTAGVPAGGMPVDTSHPDHVVGSGTAASCTFDALDAAVMQGGIITFDCGS